MKQWLKSLLSNLTILIAIFPAFLFAAPTDWQYQRLIWGQAQLRDLIIIDHTGTAPREAINSSIPYTEVESAKVYQIAKRFNISPNKAYQIYIRNQTEAQDIIHVVQLNQGLYEIAEKYGISADDVIVANDIVHLDFLAPGRELIIPISGPPGRNTSIFAMYGNSAGSLLQGQYTVRPGDTVAEIAAYYGLSASTIIEANQLKGDLRIGQKLSLPNDYQYIIPSVGRLYWPIDTSQDYYLSNFYQPGHQAIDIVLDEGSPVLAMADGYVATAGWSDIGYGNYVVINHGNNFYSLYGHLDGFYVKEGDYVNRESIIGFSGNTGNSASPHLHLELKEGLRFLDPCLYLPGYCLRAD